MQVLADQSVCLAQTVWNGIRNSANESLERLHVHPPVGAAVLLRALLSNAPAAESDALDAIRC